jgi:hypothetical protein
VFATRMPSVPSARTAAWATMALLADTAETSVFAGRGQAGAPSRCRDTRDRASRSARTGTSHLELEPVHVGRSRLEEREVRIEREKALGVARHARLLRPIEPWTGADLEVTASSNRIRTIARGVAELVPQLGEGRRDLRARREEERRRILRGVEVHDAEIDHDSRTRRARSRSSSARKSRSSCQARRRSSRSRRQPASPLRSARRPPRRPRPIARDARGGRRCRTARSRRNGACRSSSKSWP